MGTASGVEVTVSDGTVDLYGCILDERERTALRVLVENILGVKAVRNHLVWIDPTSGRFVQPMTPAPCRAAPGPKAEGEPDKMIKTILVPSSGDASDAGCFDTALTIARAFASHIDVLHVKVDPVEVALAMTRSPAATADREFGIAVGAGRRAARGDRSAGISGFLHARETADAQRPGRWRNRRIGAMARRNWRRCRDHRLHSAERPI